MKPNTNTSKAAGPSALSAFAKGNAHTLQLG